MSKNIEHTLKLWRMLSPAQQEKRDFLEKEKLGREIREAEKAPRRTIPLRDLKG